MPIFSLEASYIDYLKKEAEKAAAKSRMDGNGDEDDMVDSDAIVERTMIGNEGKLKNQTNANATAIS